MENSTASPTVTLDDSNFEKEVTQSDQTVLVDFWAPWCGPCKMIAPLLDEIATEKVGRELRLLADQPLVARTEADAPEVDTRVILSQPAAVGEFTTRRITGSRGYDLLA